MTKCQRYLYTSARIWQGSFMDMFWKTDRNVAVRDLTLNYSCSIFTLKNEKKILDQAIIEVLFGRPLGSDQSCGKTVGRRPSVSTQHFSSKSWGFCLLGFSTFLLHVFPESDIKRKQISSRCLKSNCAKQKRRVSLAELTSLHGRL